MSAFSPPDAIRKTIVVRCGVETAFRTWTEQINAWWPKGHSRSGNPNIIIVMEHGLGGRLYERTPEGIEYDWGQIIDWNPPHHFTYYWYLGSSAEQPTRVDVQFIAQANGSTRVDVKHHGPELIGELWLRTNTIFDAAWEHLLPAYIAACNPII